jgi:gas vesicle protein
MLPNPLDPGFAGLYGALIGAGSAVTVQIIAAIVTARHETRSFRRTLRKETMASVADAYEHALNVVMNMKRGAVPDKSTRGNGFAQISLRGSSRVKELVRQFLDLPETEVDWFFWTGPIVNL